MTPVDRWNEWTLLLPHAVAMLFAFAFGACSGSFVNVIAWRMPQGMSIVRPPSRCPVCGHRLRWFENIPVVSYLLLRARCGACKAHIPAQYLIIELAMGTAFVAAYSLLFLPGFDSYWYPVGNGWWTAQGLSRAWPGVVVVLMALSALAAMTLADARTFHIPTAVPAWAAAVALGGWLVQGQVAGAVRYPWPIQVPPIGVMIGAAGAMAGLALSWMLLRAGVLRPSFADYDDFVKEGEIFAQYPHSRREMAKELRFLLFPVVAGGLGLASAYWFGGGQLFRDSALELGHSRSWVVPLLASCTGFLVGGAIVWLVRIVATLVFDVEALGLGDVHLMAALGAAFGWRAALVGFMVAPFIGLAWWLIRLTRHAPMRMPFGPSLAIGGTCAFFLWPVLTTIFGWVRHNMAWMAEVARAHPQVVLVAGLVFAAGSVWMASMAGRNARLAGVGSAGSILLMVVGVVAWILSSPGGAIGTAVGGVALAVAAIAASRAAQAETEEDGGPRTALHRIMRLMLLMVVSLGLLLVLVTAKQPPEILPGGTGQEPALRVQ